MHYFGVILLSDIIWAFGPKVTRRVTYLLQTSDGDRAGDDTVPDVPSAGASTRRLVQDAQPARLYAPPGGVENWRRR